jgi:HK97 family phage portal protein
LWGDAYSEIRSGSSGAVDQLIPLHPSRMKVETLENGSLRYTYREAKGRQTIYTDEQILHLRGPSDDGVHGMSIVEECREAIALARACEIHGSRFFGAGARPGFILSTDNPLNADARRELADNWNRKHRGPQNAFETAVLTGGLKPYEIPYATNTDSQFLELRAYQLAEIARLFRVPMHLLGVMNGGYGSIEHAGLDFVQHTILPWLRRFESAFTRDLITDDEKYFVEFDVRGLLRGDSASRSQYYRAMWDIGALSTNDILELENRNPVEGGDTRYRPLNMGTLGQDPTAADVAAQQQPGSGIDGQAVEGGMAAADAGPAVSPDASLTPPEVTSLLTITKQITDGLLSVDAARAIITAAFPVLSAARVETILQGVAVKKEESAETAAPAPVAEAASSESRAAPGTVAEGDFVSWDSSGGRARGRIDHVMDYGTLDVPGTDFTIEASEEDPAALITVYEEVSGGWRPTGTQVGHKVATLTKIDPLPEPPAKPARRLLPVAKRDCGTGAGGFKPGNKCAGEGGGGADSGGGSSGGGGDSSGGSGGSVEQAKPGDGPLVKAARDEHKKALDKARKDIAKAQEKARQGHRDAMLKHSEARMALEDHLATVKKLSDESISVLKEAEADPSNNEKWSRVEKVSSDLMKARLDIEPLEKAEAKARKAKEKAQANSRSAVAKALAKECASVDKEDGFTAADRKRSVQAVEETHASGSQITSWATEQNLPESVALSKQEYATEQRTNAQAFLRSAVNPMIHTKALEGPIEYKDGVRANAAGTADEYDYGVSSDVVTPARNEMVGRTQLAPDSSASTVIHEFGHQIEHGNVEAAKLCHDFLQSRTVGQQSELFSDKFPGSGYGFDEKGSPDDFAKAVRAVENIAPGAASSFAENTAYYAGKKYQGNGEKSASGWTRYGATEVLSIGMELLAKDAVAFANADPEWFDLVTGITTGRILSQTRAKRRSR